MLRLSRILRSQWLFAAACFCLSLVFACRAGAQAPLYQFTSLGTLPGFTASSFAYAINAAGQVVGYSQSSSGTAHAFLWTPSSPNGSSGTMHGLGFLPGDTDSFAYAINGIGQVVGYSHSSTDQAFLWTPSKPNGSSGTMRDLGVLPGGTSSQASGINAAGQVVGYANLPGGNAAFLWQNGMLLNLNSLISAGSGATLTGAKDINAGGQIVGEYSSDRSSISYLLTPIGHIFQSRRR